MKKGDTVTETVVFFLDPSAEHIHGGRRGINLRFASSIWALRQQNAYYFCESYGLIFLIL